MAAGRPSIAYLKQLVATGDLGGLVRLARDPASLGKPCGSTRFQFVAVHIWHHREAATCMTMNWADCGVNWWNP